MNDLGYIILLSVWFGFLVGVSTLGFITNYADKPYETLEQRKQTIESKCSEANSTPESFDKSSVTCKNGARFDLTGEL